MENQQSQQPAIDTRVKATKGKKREFKNRKTFSLKAMEALVEQVSFLKSKYDALAVNAQEKLGYHYNEILNILLFHKYVKSNKKLFVMYKKIKDAINKGYEFEKPKKKKKLKENAMGKVINKSEDTHFAINKKTNKILESWNYEGYDHEELKQYKNEFFTKDIKRNYPHLNENDITVITKKNLTKRKLNESSKADWQKFNYSHFALLKETNHILYGYDYSNVDSEDLKNNKNEYFLNVLSEVYGSDISPKDVVVVKSSKLSKLGIKDSLNETNWAGLINEAYCGGNMEEEMIDEEMDDNVYEYEVPDWALSALINGDVSGLSDEDEQKLDKFIDEVVSEVGNANFYGGNEEDSLGFRRSNDIDNLGSDVYKVYVRKDTLDETTSMGGGAGIGMFGADGPPVMRGTFDLSPNQPINGGIPRNTKIENAFRSLQSFGVGKPPRGKGNMKINPKTGIVTPDTTRHEAGGGKRIKVNESTNSLIDLNALMNDEIIEYKKIDNNQNKFKSPRIELIRENNRDSIIEFLIKHQGRELPEVYNKKQFTNMALKSLNEHYNKLVQRLGLLEEEKKPDALVRIDALKKKSENDSNSYYKKDASNKTTTMLVQKGEGDGLVYDKDSKQRKDIPMYKFQSDHQKQYLEVRRGLEDFEVEKGPNGEVDPVWLARKEALMGDSEVGKKAFKDAQKRIDFKDKNKLGTGRGRAVLLQKDLPAVKQQDKVLKESSFTVIKEGNILDQVQSYYFDDENRKKPVIFDSNNIIEMDKINENKLTGCKELTYKGLGQTLSEDFNEKVLNKKLLYSPDSKKVFLV